VLVLRFLDPPLSSFMLLRAAEAWREGDDAFRLRQQWVAAARIPDHVGWAVIAAEDQRFYRHRGFDLHAIEAALRESAGGPPRRGASTLTQQVAKNLFLWPGRSWLRKALEAWFTLWIELLWAKERVLHVYLNVAEFGDGIYGVAAASRHFFAKDPEALTRQEAALLAAVLPSPRRLRPDRPSPWLEERRDWILRQMRQLGARRGAAPRGLGSDPKVTLALGDEARNGVAGRRWKGFEQHTHAARKAPAARLAGLCAVPYQGPHLDRPFG
jgi:monofunctional glycosyltransferase